MTDLGYLSQAVAIGRLSQYAPLLIDHMTQLLKHGRLRHNKTTGEVKPWHVKDDFAFVQCLVSIAQVATNESSIELLELTKLQSKINKVVSDLGAELNDSYAQLLPAIICSYDQLGWTIPPRFIENALPIVESNYESLHFSSKVML